MKTRLTPEEEEIIEYVEGTSPQSIPNVHDEIERYRNLANQQMTKKKAISIRLLEADLEGIKARAIREGIPYQTLISSIIHKYLMGDLKSA